MVKDRFIGILCMCLVLQVLSGCDRIPSGTGRPPAITNEPIVINAPLNNPINNIQYDADVYMTTADGKLYFYSRSSSINPFAYHIAVFDNGSIDPVCRIHGAVFYAIGPYFYYYKHAEDPYTVDVYCYNVLSGQDEYLLSSLHKGGVSLHPCECYYEEDGVLYIPQDEEEYLHYPVVGTTVGEPVKKQVEYQYGTMSYVYQWREGGKLTGCDREGNILYYHERIPTGFLSVIPCEDGLLIHNPGNGNLLYFIVGETGEVITLFEFPCDRSYSAVNVYGDYAYFSVLRFRNFDLFAAWFPGDDKYGTYRIDLRTLEMEQISRNVYDALYIFDDNGIFACDLDECIYKLDFDGNVIMTLYEY